MSMCITGLNGLEFSVKTGDYTDMIRASSVDLLDPTDEESDSCQSRRQISSITIQDSTESKSAVL